MINIAQQHQALIKSILKKHVPDCEVRVFGSRLNPLPKTYSDLDIAIVGKGRLPDKVIFALKEDFEESDLPFRVDVLDWNAITEEFKSIINNKFELLQNPAA